jgi:hypothetical protein
MGCSLPSRKGLGMRSPRLLVPLVLMDAFSRTTAIIVVEAAHRRPLFGAERCNADVGEEISSLSGQLPPVFSQHHTNLSANVADGSKADTWRLQFPMSASPPKADIVGRDEDVR